MKCFRRSIKLFVSRIVFAVALAAALGAARPVAQTGTPVDERVRSAIEQTVGSLVGPMASVTVSDLTGVRLAETTGALLATIDPAAKTGQPTRFILSEINSGVRTRVGEATALVTVTTESVRIRRAVSRGSVLDAEDVETAQAPLAGTRFEPSPSIDVVVGARAARSLEPGSIVTASDLVREPMVKAGDRVRAMVRLAGVEIETTVVAVQAGARDDLIPLVNPATRRPLRGRVTGNGEVEVVDAR